MATRKTQTPTETQPLTQQQQFWTLEYKLHSEFDYELNITQYHTTCRNNQQLGTKSSNNQQLCEISLDKTITRTQTSPQKQTIIRTNSADKNSKYSNSKLEDLTQTKPHNSTAVIKNSDTNRTRRTNHNSN